MVFTILARIIQIIGCYGNIPKSIPRLRPARTHTYSIPLTAIRYDIRNTSLVPLMGVMQICPTAVQEKATFSDPEVGEVIPNNGYRLTDQDRWCYFTIEVTEEAGGCFR